MEAKEKFICREISLLAFNRRVLAQAQNDNIPLLERLRFLCIVSSNLDEFFEVRMAWLKNQHKLNPNLLLMNGDLPYQVIQNVTQKAHRLISDQYHIFNNELVPLLRQEGIYFYHRHEWSQEQSDWIEEYFKREVYPVLTPIGLDPSHPFPRPLNKSLNFAVELDGKDAFGRASGMAIVQAPRILPRVVALPSELCDGNTGFVFLSSIVHSHVNTLFRGMKVKGCHQFRLTRDSELTVDEEDLKDLRTAIQGELHDRQYGKGVRLEVATNCPNHVSDFLLAHFNLSESELYQVNGPVNLVRLMSVIDMVERPDLKYQPFLPSLPKALQTSRGLFDVLRKEDVLLHHPYQSFQPVMNFIEDAATDPNVVAIKMTIYRTGANSDLVKSLLAATLAGKQVTVVVELRARFDEETNVNWARKLEQVGAHVVYGVFGYKVHAKMALVVRKEDGQLKSYAHLGTGNYHQSTSRFYTDLGIMTSDEKITSDVNQLFMEITGLGQPSKLSRLYQSPFTLYNMLLSNIDSEITAAKNGQKALIIAKMNSLLEPTIIEKLYEASQAGVKIQLIVRGMCALRAGVPGLSENISVYSIVGRLLEHSRVFYFYHNQEEKVFISSADWMGRNFFRRIETCTPILQPALKERVIRETLSLALEDNCQAWKMLENGSYEKLTAAENQPHISLQNTLINEYTDSHV